MYQERFMRAAMAEAEKAAMIGEVPVGAVAVAGGVIIGGAVNDKELLADPTAHAEILLIRKIASLKESWRLIGVDIYVTLEPCVMCVGAMVQGRVNACYFGALDHKFGGAGSLYDIPEDPRLNHRFSCAGGYLADEIIEMMREFFKDLRERKKQR